MESCDGSSSTLLFSFVLLGITAWLFVIIPKGFFPTEDTGFLTASTEGAEDTSFEQMIGYQQQVADIVAKNPYVAAIQSSVGSGGGSSAGNAGRMFIRLKDRSTRPHADVVVQQLRRELAGVIGVNTFIQIPPAIRVGGGMSKSLYQFTLQDTDLKKLYEWAPKVEAAWPASRACRTSLPICESPARN